LDDLAIALAPQVTNVCPGYRPRDLAEQLFFARARVARYALDFWHRIEYASIFLVSRRPCDGWRCAGMTEVWGPDAIPVLSRDLDDRRLHEEIFGPANHLVVVASPDRETRDAVQPLIAGLECPAQRSNRYARRHMQHVLDADPSPTWAPPPPGWSVPNILICRSQLADAIKLIHAARAGRNPEVVR
jgi:hypothetical protein